jgi:hypothetical protein
MGFPWQEDEPSRLYEGCELGERDRRSPPEPREYPENLEICRDKLNENSTQPSSGDNIEFQLRKLIWHT